MHGAPQFVMVHLVGEIRGRKDREEARMEGRNEGGKEK